MAALLLKNEAQLDIQNNKGQSCLILATLKCYSDVVQLLLDSGGDISHQDMHFNTAFHYACMLDYKEIIEIFLKKAT